MSISNKVFVIRGSTESGDDWMFLSKKGLSDEEIVKVIKTNPWLSEEYEAGCIQSWTTGWEEVLDG